MAPEPSTHVAAARSGASAVGASCRRHVRCGSHHRRAPPETRHAPSCPVPPPRRPRPLRDRRCAGLGRSHMGARPRARDPSGRAGLSRTARSARRTSCSPTPPTSTSARPRTARAPAAPPTPTAARRRSLPVGTPVDVTGAGQPGTLVYNSWLTMQALGETDADTCAYNDLALVQHRPGRRRPRSTRRSRSGAGRPASTRTARVAGDKVSATATPSCAAASTALSPKEGVSLGDDGERLVAHRLHGDARHPRRLGQRVPRRDRQALGVLSTVAIAPLAGSNGVGDLAHPRAESTG